VGFLVGFLGLKEAAKGLLPQLSVVVR